MSELWSHADAESAHAALSALLPEGLTLTVYRSGVVNVNRSELARADVDAVRAAFAKLGWTELEAWLPVQGMSWLSDGISAGVSFRVQR